MVQAKVQAPLRILNLALNLLNTREGLGRVQLMTVVRGYGATDSASAQRVFERDIEHLRRMGLAVDVQDRFDAATYRISASSLPAQGTILTDREVALLLRAVDAWSDGSGEMEALRNKLRGFSETVRAPQQSSTRFSLESANGLEIVQGAIEQARPVAFDYLSQKGASQRCVAPWRVIVRGRALYLWGFDLDAWEPRLFRFSRFLTVPAFAAPPDSTPSQGPLQEVAFDPDFFLIQPVMLVRHGSSPITSAHSTPLPEVDSAEAGSTAAMPAPEDRGLWQRRVGEREDAHIWEERLLREARDIRVLEPSWLAELIETRLRSAAAWREEDRA